MAPNFKPNSYNHDLTRDEIIARFRDRIAYKKRTKLTKDELGQLILHFIDQLQSINSAAKIRARCEAEIALLEEGYPQSTLASDYIPKYRKAIKSAIAEGKIPTNKRNSHHVAHIQRVTGVEEERFEHYALTYFKYDKDVYESLDSRSADTNRTRQVSLRRVEPHQYLLQLAELLDAQDKFAARKQALAIAGLTGRRIGEVLALGQFQLSSHPHLLRFEGHQKTLVAAYDIVTLIPAEQLLGYIQQFRASDEIRPLLKLEGEALTKAINKQDVQINRECVKHLGGIVPPLSARSSISIHNLRSLWGAIAVWLFCPDNQHEYPFIQHYLGHAIDSNATGHYFRYQLVDSSGSPIRDKGVKLSDVGELPLFTESKAARSVADTSASPTPVEIPAIQDAPDSEAAEAATSPNASPAMSDEDSKVDSTAPPHAQTSAIEKDQAPAPSPTDEPALIPSPAAAVTDFKVVQLSYYQRDRIRLTQLLDTISPADGNEQQKISALLDWAEQQLHCALGGGSLQDVDLQSTATDALAKLNEVIATDDQRLPPSTPTPKLSSTPAATSISPLELLVATAVTDQARTLGVLASRVETLEAQLALLQHERDRALDQLAIAQSVPTILQDQLEHLQAENTHLRHELKRFDAIRRAFLGELGQEISHSSAPTTQADSTPTPAQITTQAQSTPAPAPMSTTPVATISNGVFANPHPSSPKPKSHPLPTSSTNSDRLPRKGAAITRAEGIFHALVAWNTQHPDDTFAMTDWLLEGVFKVNRKAAKQFCQEFHDVIEQHHVEIGIDNLRSHNRGRDTSPMKAFVNNFSADG